jgi:Na+/H+ antiporter NhaD/arsenite permease-like protein
MHSRQVLGLVDWELLVLFVGLFVVNHALQATGLPARAVEALAGFTLGEERRQVLWQAWWVSPIARSAWLEARGLPIVQGASDETG